MKKERTLNKIIDTSISIFSRLPYEEVALSQICVEAQVSNGTIYNYFKSKEELFKYLLAETGIRLEKAFDSLTGDSVESRLEDFIRINLLITKKEYSLIKIYREGQYKFIEYEQVLRKIYIHALQNIFGKTINEFEYLYIMSGIRFINIIYTNKNETPDIKFLSKIITKGGFKGSDFSLENLKEQTLYTIIPFNPNNKKAQLLFHGEKLFGEKGYSNVKITDIAKSANIAIGTFYNYFEKKEQFLEEITTQLTKSVLFFLEFNTSNIKDLFEKQITYMFLMITFFENSPYKYQIIRESEFISQDISRDFLQKVETLYLNSFTDTDFSEKEKVLLSNFFMGISHYIGIELFFTKNIDEKFKVLEHLSHYLKNGILG